MRNPERPRLSLDDADDMFAAAPLPVAALDDTQRLACLRLIRSENVGPVGIMAQTPLVKPLFQRAKSQNKEG